MEPLPTPADWKERVLAELGEGASFDQTLLTRTLEGLVLEPLYTADDAPARTPQVMPLGGGWAATQAASHPVPRAANRRILDDLEGGASGLLVDLGAVRLADLEDARRLLDGVLLEAVPVAFTSQAEALPLAAVLLALLDERGAARDAVALHLGMDPFAALARDGALPGDMDDARRELGRLASFSRLHLDRARCAAVDGGVWHRAGADDALELGLAAASLLEALRWLEEDGLPPAAAHAEFVWRTDLGADVFGGIAKCRAARILQARILGAAGVEQATPLVLHATTSPRIQTARDAWTNMLRGTLGAFAAAAGGADLITVVPFDAPIVDATPGSGSSALARRVARNTQLVLAMESRLDHVGDPGRGGYHVEARTDALARAAWGYIQRVEAAGGMAAALGAGVVDELIAESRGRLERAFADGERSLVGVTHFPPPGGADEPRPEPLGGLEADAEARRSRLAARGPVAIGAIDELDHAIRAAAGGATLEELGGALVRGAALHRESLPIAREELLAGAAR